MTRPGINDGRLHIGIVLFVLAVAFVNPVAVLADAPYLTGVIEDDDSQKIEMPSLPFTWMRQVAWLAPEGSFVEVGDVVVRVDPGSLVEEEERLEASYEEQLVASEIQRAESQLAIIDAEMALEVARTTRDLAWLDAQIPATAATQLNYDRAQLALENADNALRLAEETLANARRKFDELAPVLNLRVETAEAWWSRVKTSLSELEIRAERPGVVIYAENEFSGMKVFAGETLQPGDLIVTIATRGQLQFVFWVHDADINQMREGQKLAVIADALPDRIVDAEVDWVANYATDRETWSQGGYFKVVAKPMSNLPESFVPGMAVSAEIF